MSLPDKCPTCLRADRSSPASILQSLERDVETWQAEADRLASIADRLAARVAELEEALENVINAGKPNQREHPSMWQAWLKARLVMQAKEAKP